jgi:hypothetical protein
MSLLLDTQEWAQQQFGSCDLGDVRRTRRLVQFASQVAADPDASTPGQTEKWADLKAAYRLIDNADVTFEAIATPHWQATRQQAPGTYLISCDTTEVDFGWDNEATGLGPLGKGSGRGFLLHSGLMIHPGTEEVIGLAGQKIRYRKPAPKKESITHRLTRDRESHVWGELIDQIGPPSEGVRFIDVCDRGADNFEVYCKLLLNRHDWIVRAARLKRVVKYQGKEMPLADCLDQFPLAGTYKLSYRSAEHGSRTAQIEVRHGMVMMPAPRQKSPWLRELGITMITMNVVEVREVKAPKGVEPLHWVLLTSLPVTNFDQSWTVIGYYEKRPVVEEFHKALKTGCRVEDRQYETSERLEAITALLSVSAVRLLQLRSASRETPQRPASEVVPSRWVTMLSCLRGNRPIKTVRDFYRQLAGLGGHMLRKSDGSPGWITLWRGFEKLHMALRAVRQYRKRCG